MSLDKKLTGTGCARARAKSTSKSSTAELASLASTSSVELEPTRSGISSQTLPFGLLGSSGTEAEAMFVVLWPSVRKLGVTVIVREVLLGLQSSQDDECFWR